MAFVTCVLCNKRVNRTAANYVFADGQHQHKKCATKPVLSPEEVKDKRELEIAIEWASINKALSTKYGLNWSLIGSQIKRMKDNGYSYKQQLYALNFIVEQDGGFWGYGRVEKFMPHAMAHMKKREEFERRMKEIKEQPLRFSPGGGEISKVVSKPSFFNVADDDLEL